MILDAPKFNWSNITPPYDEYPYFREICFTDDHRLLADACTLAYADPTFTNDHWRRADFCGVRFFDRNGTQCYIVERDGISIVVFRGTQSNLKIDTRHSLEVMIDFWTDLDATRTRRKGVLIHSGFYKALDEVWDALSTEIEGKLVIFTGHSLGAALATIAAFRHPYPAYVKSLVTFGSPRVGDLAFKHELERRIKITRYVHGSDGVPNVPPEALDFVHVGEEKRLGTSGEGRPEKFRRGCLRLPVPHAWLPIPSWIYDHNPVLYAHQLWKLHCPDRLWGGKQS